MSITQSKFANPPTQQAPAAVQPASAAEPQPFQGYYVVRTFGGNDPMTTVMDLDHDEAVQVCKDTQPTRGKGPANADGTRDQDVYVSDRLAAEHWVRDGSNLPKNAAQHPIYMAITKDPEAVAKLMAQKPWPGQKILVAPVTPEMMKNSTVTDGDSMGQYFSATGYREADGSTPFLSPTNSHLGQVLDVNKAAQIGLKEGELQYWGRAPLAGQKVYNAADMSLIDPKPGQTASITTPAAAAPAAAATVKAKPQPARAAAM